jgi:hypothetical protein
MRAEKYKRATDAAREGILPGLLEGGGSLVTGIASGVTGLFSRPIEVRTAVWGVWGGCVSEMKMPFEVVSFGDLFRVVYRVGAWCLRVLMSLQSGSVG